MVKHLIEALNKSECDAMPKMEGMCTMLHRLVLTPEHCARFLSTLPGSTQKADERCLGQSSAVLASVTVAALFF